MAISRDQILGKLRAARQPFPDAPPRPKQYIPVTRLEDDSPDALLERFTAELTRLTGEVFVVEGEDAARDCLLDLIKSHAAQAVLAWDLRYIPVQGLGPALKDAGIAVQYPDIHGEFRDDILHQLAEVPVGLTGADAAAASTGSLIVSTAVGKGRIPTILPRVHIAVIEQAQILPRVENWIAQQRADNLADIRASANLCLITGPSRTADIEKKLVLGMHGPEQLQVVVKKSGS